MKTKTTSWISRALLAVVVSGTLTSCASTGDFSAMPPPVRHSLGPPGLLMTPPYPLLPT